MPTAQILCESCGAPSAADRPKCAACGGRVVRVCADCGQKLSLAKRWCDSCGGSLEGIAATPVSGEHSPPPKELIFETLAESAALELEEHERKKGAPRPAEPPAAKPKPAEPRAPQPEPIQIKLPADSPPPAAEPPRRPEPAEGKPADSPKPAEKPSSGLNERPGINLQVPGSSAAAPAAPPRDLGLPHTVIGRVVRPAGEPKPAERPPEPRTPAPARRSEPGRFAPPPPAAKAPPPPPAKPPPSPPPKPKPQPAAGDGARRVEKNTRAGELTRSPWMAKASTGLALLLLLSGAGLWFARRRHLQRDEVQVPITARRYLAALKASDFGTAYQMLTSASQRACPIEEFRKVRDASAWDFSDLSAVAIEGDLAFVRYLLRVEGRDPEEDFLVFEKEGGAWRRPFVWNLLRDVEAAFERDDAAGALRLARAAQAVNPRDPMSQAYVCEGLFYLRDAAQAPAVEKECQAALGLAEKYPSALSLNSANLYHIHAILADNFKNGLRRYKEASEHYTALLMFPRLSPADQCEVLLGRAECQLALQEFPAAVQDFTRAATACETPADAQHARRMASVYSGSATREAIELVQQHPIDAGGATALNWRKQARAELTAEWKAAGRGPLPPETWEAQHLGGAQYRVDVRAGAAVLFSARADLWTKLVQMGTQ